MPGQADSELPFSHLNLRYNPFGEPEAEERVELAVIDGLELVTGEVLQIIGDSGRGKTTHLLALSSKHPDASYVRIEPGGRPRGMKGLRWVSRFVRQQSSASPLLVDEAQFLRLSALHHLCRCFGTLVLGTHYDLSDRCPRVTRTLLLGRLDAGKLSRIIEKRLAWARRAPGPVPSVPEATTRELIGRYGNDIRAIEDHLYEIFQRLEEPTSVQM